MPLINVVKLKYFPEAEFGVTVNGNTVTQHKVLLMKDYFERLTEGNSTPEKLIEKSFEFLLEREANTSILTEFNLEVISNYFPEYEKIMTGL